MILPKNGDLPHMFRDIFNHAGMKNFILFGKLLELVRRNRVNWAKKFVQVFQVYNFP